ISKRRAAWSVIWSCLATILAGACVGNIPDPRSSGIHVGLKRAAMAVLAVLLPEVFVGWAVRQWLNARRIAKKNEELANDVRENMWTNTHGFLVLMRGFYCLDPGNVPHPLSSDEVEACIRDGSLELPTKSQINDKSKGGAFSRTVASLQTMWFVMQSLARPIQQLPITMLEVATLAYTLITVALHIFWWSKPLNISQPFRV
ncbi:hypothetical protein FIBSPDRAFT_674227, partial [Athelia psychrophila]